MPDVFISYAREDTEFVRRVYDDLSKNERDAWIDWEDIPLTADWLAEAYAGIESADAFLFIISPASVKSGPCTLELEHALANNKRLIPILRREVTDPEEFKLMHPSLSAHNWVRCREDDDYDTGFGAVLSAIDTDLDYIRAHTRYIVRASEWEDNHDPSLLLRGNDLMAAEEWLRLSEEKQPTATDLQRNYILASRVAARQRFRLTLLAVAVVTMIISLAVAAVLQSIQATQNAELARRNEAQARANEAQARSFSLAAGAQQSLYLDSNNDLSIALALEAVRIPEAPPLAGSVLAQAAYAPGTRLRLSGFSGEVSTGLAMSSDGSQILAASEDQSLVLLDTATGEELNRWPVNNLIRRIAFGPVGTAAEGKALLVLNDYVENSNMVLVDLATGEQSQPWSSEGYAYDAAFTPDGLSVVAAYYFNEINQVILWSLADGSVIWRFDTGREDGATSIAVSPDGLMAAAGFTEGVILLLDLTTGEVPREFSGHSGLVQSITFRADSRSFLSTGWDNAIILWDVGAKQAVRRYDGHTYFVYGAAVTGDGGRMYSVGLDGNVFEWDVNTGQRVRTFVGHTAGVYGLGLSPDGKTLVTGSADSTVRVWELINGAEIQELEGHSSEVNKVLFTHTDNGGRAMSVSSDQTAALWDIQTGKILWRFNQYPSPVWAADISPDDATALIGFGDGNIALIDLTTADVIRWFSGHENGVFSVAFSPDGRTFLSGTFDPANPAPALILWDVASGRQIRAMQGHTGQIWSVAFSSDGRHALTGSGDNTAMYWDIETGQVVHTLRGHTSVVYDVSISPDGRFAITGSQDATIILWDLASGEAIRSFTGHTDDVYRVTFSADGRTALSSSLDRTARLWDIASGAEFLRFAGHTGQIRWVDFSPDGHTFLSASADMTVRQWQIATLDELIQWTFQHRYILPLSCEIRTLYGVQPACDAAGNAPVAAPFQTGDNTLAIIPTPSPDATLATAAPEPSVTPTLSALTASMGDNRSEVVLGSYDWWTFSGSPGQQVTIRILADNPATGVETADRLSAGVLDTLLRVRSSDGFLLQVNDDEPGGTTDSTVEGLEIPADGVLIIEVRAYDDLTTGAYTLRIEPYAPSADSTDEATALLTPTAPVSALLEAIAGETTPEATPEAEATP